MPHDYKNPELEYALTNIMDTFSGGDNEKFVAFLFLIRELDKRAWSGDESARILISIVHKFSNLINVSAKHA